MATMTTMADTYFDMIEDLKRERRSEAKSILERHAGEAVFSDDRRMRHKDFLIVSKLEDNVYVEAKADMHWDSPNIDIELFGYAPISYGEGIFKKWASGQNKRSGTYWPGDPGHEEMVSRIEELLKDGEGCSKGLGFTDELEPRHVLLYVMYRETVKKDEDGIVIERDQERVRYTMYNANQVNDLVKRDFRKFGLNYTISGRSVNPSPNNWMTFNVLVPRSILLEQCDNIDSE